MLICLVCITFGAQAQQAQRYAIKSGYLKLELSGNTVGTKELWWDNYGDKTCEIEKSTTTTKVFAIKSVDEKHTLTILDKNKYWVVDYLNAQATTGHVLGYQTGQELYSSMTESEQKELEEEVLADFGGQRLGSEKLGSYNCEVFKVLGVKSWIYKGLPLKTEGTVLGISSNNMFKEFKPGINVPASKFIAPNDVSYENLSSASSELWGDILEEGEEEVVSHPLSYDYDKFKNVIDKFTYPGFICRGTNNVDGMYASTFTKGFSNSLMIIAQSGKNTEDGEYNMHESFMLNGQKCHYGEIEDEDGTALLIEYPKNEMVVVIASIPSLGKSELVAIAKKLNF